MTTANADEGTESLAFLTEWCRAMLAFFKNVESPWTTWSMFEDVVTQTLEKGNLKGMQTIARDLMEGASALAEGDWEELDRSLRLKFGKGLQEAGEREVAKVNLVLKRGKIKNKADYRVLSTRAEEIYADKSKKEELEKINALLAKYHEEHQ